ncbi:MAG: GerMN domain-containing protein [Anaerovoracaceae bacterium]
MKKRIMALGLAMVLTISTVAMITGCGEKEPGKEPATSYQIVLGFVNADYVNTGNEKLTKIIDVETEATFPSERDMYLQAIELLRESNMAKVQDGVKDNLTTAYYDRYQINDIVVEDSLATVDFDGEYLTGSSLQESMLISQIVETLTKSFDQIMSVKFTVNGEEAETLFGHIDLTQEFGEKIL